MCSCGFVTVPFRPPLPDRRAGTLIHPRTPRRRALVYVEQSSSRALDYSRQKEAAELSASGTDAAAGTRGDLHRHVCKVGLHKTYTLLAELSIFCKFSSI